MIDRLKNALRNNAFTGNYYNKASKAVKLRRVQKKGLRLAAEITTILNSAGFLAFPDFGTLLGIVREGGLLKGDLDIDIGVAPVCYDERIRTGTIQKALEKRGFILFRELSVDEKIKEQTYLKNKVRCDIQYYYPTSDDLMHCYLFYDRESICPENRAGCNLPEGIHAYKMKCCIKTCPRVSSLKEVKAGDTTLFIPENSEELLAYKYGDSWRVPDSKWKYWEGPNTTKISDSGLQIYYDK